MSLMKVNEYVVLLLESLMWKRLMKNDYAVLVLSNWNDGVSKVKMIDINVASSVKINSMK